MQDDYELRVGTAGTSYQYEGTPVDVPSQNSPPAKKWCFQSEKARARFRDLTGG